MAAKYPSMLLAALAVLARVESSPFRIPEHPAHIVRDAAPTSVQASAQAITAITPLQASTYLSVQPAITYQNTEGEAVVTEQQSTIALTTLVPYPDSTVTSITSSTPVIQTSTPAAAIFVSDTASAAASTASLESPTGTPESQLSSSSSSPSSSTIVPTYSSRLQTQPLSPSFVPTSRSSASSSQYLRQSPGRSRTYATFTSGTTPTTSSSPLYLSFKPTLRTSSVGRGLTSSAFAVSPSSNAPAKYTRSMPLFYSTTRKGPSYSSKTLASSTLSTYRPTQTTSQSSTEAHYSPVYSSQAKSLQIASPYHATTARSASAYASLSGKPGAASSFQTHTRGSLSPAVNSQAFPTFKTQTSRFGTASSFQSAVTSSAYTSQHYSLVMGYTASTSTKRQAVPTSTSRGVATSQMSSPLSSGVATSPSLTYGQDTSSPASPPAKSAVTNYLSSVFAPSASTIMSSYGASPLRSTPTGGMPYSTQETTTRLTLHTTMTSVVTMTTRVATEGGYPPVEATASASYPSTTKQSYFLAPSFYASQAAATASTATTTTLPQADYTAAMATDSYSSTMQAYPAASSVASPAVTPAAEASPSAGGNGVVLKPIDASGVSIIFITVTQTVTDTVTRAMATATATVTTTVH